MLVVFSPHLDDAVFSCGALIAERDALIVTVCAGIPDENVAPAYFDELAGHRSAADAIRRRQEEDVNAAGTLSVTDTLHLPCLEDQYAAGVDGPSIDTNIEQVCRALDSSDVVLGPLGLRHPDHVRVSEAFRTHAVKSRAASVWLYEELPYRVLWPEFLPRATARADCGPIVERIDPNPSSKHRALQCYPSQLVGMNTEPLLMPERYHLLAGDGDLW